MKSLLMDEASILTIINELNLMLVWVDESGIIRETTVMCMGQPAHEIIGRPVREVFPALIGIEDELQRIASGDAPPWRIPGLQLVEGQPFFYDMLFIRPQGRGGLLIAAREMTVEQEIESMLRQQRNELVLLQERLQVRTLALRKANERLTTIDRERRTLVELIAHDFKLALSLISGYAEHLSTDPTIINNPNQTLASATIVREAQRLNELIEDVLTLGRTENRLAQIELSPVQPALILEHALAMLTGLAQSRQVHLRSVIEAPALNAWGDAQLLQEALNSLLQMSIDTSPPDSELRVRLYLWERWLILSVRRDGTVGRKHPSGSTSTDTQRRFALTLVRLIVEGLGGHLAEEQNDSSCLSISVWLPTQTNAASGIAYAQQETESTEAEPTPEPTFVLEQTYILACGGELRVERHNLRVWVMERPLSLTPAEHRLLVLLATHAGEVVAHQEILEHVWPPDERSLDTLRVLVSRLRQKIDPTPRQPRYLHSERGFGYLLTK